MNGRLMVTPSTVTGRLRSRLTMSAISNLNGGLSSRCMRASIVSLLHGRRDQLVRPWTSLRTTEQIVSVLHVQAG